MDDKDRKIIHKLYKTLDIAKGTTQEGIVQELRDYRKFVPKVKDVLEILQYYDAPQDEIDERVKELENE